MQFIGVKDIPIDSLGSYPGNARIHNEAALDESAEVNGQYRSIVARTLPDGAMQILAGHGTREAFRRRGAETVRVELIEADDSEALRINLADNGTSRLASYDDRLLAELLAAAEADKGFAGTGWDEDAYRALVDNLVPDIPVDRDHDEFNGEPPAEPITRVGDVWVLGRHRLVCGDSSDSAVLDMAVKDDEIGCLLTDPPYGMNLDTDYSKLDASSAPSRGHKGKKYRSVEGDSEAYNASPIRDRFSKVAEQFWFGADYYRRTLSVSDSDGSWLVWDKRTPETDSVLGSAFELCWSAVPHKRDVLRHHWTNYNSHTNAGLVREHPTEKPVSLLVEILNRWAPEESHVIDPYAGSGSTLVACHSTGRSARVVEIDPRYCDVIARRYQELTGGMPVLERTGEAHDFG